MLHALVTVVFANQKPVDIEGRDIVLSMLVVGLIFLAVCVLGDLSKTISHRRRRR